MDFLSIQFKLKKSGAYSPPSHFIYIHRQTVLVTNPGGTSAVIKVPVWPS